MRQSVTGIKRPAGSWIINEEEAFFLPARDFLFEVAVERDEEVAPRFELDDFDALDAISVFNLRPSHCDY